MNKEQFWKDLKSGAFALMIKESSKGKYLLSPKEVFNIMTIQMHSKFIKKVYC